MKLTDGSAKLIFKDVITGRVSRHWDLMQMSYYTLTDEKLRTFYGMAQNEKDVKDGKVYVVVSIDAYSKN